MNEHRPIAEISFERVVQIIPLAGRICQLAEECGELVQAGSKIIRSRGLVFNPTPVSIESADKQFEEEAIDVLMAIHAIRPDWDMHRLVDKMIASPKWARWATRAEEVDL